MSNVPLLLLALKVPAPVMQEKASFKLPFQVKFAPDTIDRLALYALDAPRVPPSTDNVPQLTMVLPLYVLVPVKDTEPLPF